MWFFKKFNVVKQELLKRRRIAFLIWYLKSRHNFSTTWWHKSYSFRKPDFILQAPVYSMTELMCYIWIRDVPIVKQNHNLNSIFNVYIFYTVRLYITENCIVSKIIPMPDQLLHWKSFRYNSVSILCQRTLRYMCSLLRDLRRQLWSRQLCPWIGRHVLRMYGLSIFKPNQYFMVLKILGYICCL